jgi:hypothetical protein
LHDARLIDFDRENDAVHLSPTGAREVEALKTLIRAAVTLNASRAHG